MKYVRLNWFYLLLPLVSLLIACGGEKETNEVQQTARETLSGKGSITITMQDIKAIGGAVESYIADNGRPPIAESPERLRSQLEPLYIRLLPTTDQWGQSYRYQYHPDAETYTIASPGPDGQFENFQKKGDDILFQNGQFL